MLIMQSWYIRAVLILKCHKKAENVQVVGRKQIAGLHRSLHHRYQVSATSNKRYIRGQVFFFVNQILNVDHPVLSSIREFLGQVYSSINYRKRHKAWQLLLSCRQNMSEKN